MDLKSVAVSPSIMNFLTIISRLPTLVESKSRSLVATTRKGSKTFLTTTIRERFYVALSFTFVTFVLGLSISLRSRYKDQYVTRFVRNTLPALGTIYETMAWDTFENLENHLVSGLQLQQSETGEEVSTYLERLDLYDDAVVFQMRGPWDKLKNQRYIGFYPLDSHKLQSRKLLFQQAQEDSSIPVNILQISSRRWFTYSAPRQIGEKESTNLLQRDLSFIQKMLYKIFLSFDEIPAKLGTWSFPSMATPSMTGGGLRTPFPFLSKTDANSDWTLSNERGDGHLTPSIVERTHHNKLDDTPWPIKKVTFASTVLDAAATESTIAPLFEAFKGGSIDNNQGEVTSLLVASRGGSMAIPGQRRGGLRIPGQQRDMTRNEKESVFQQEAMEIDLGWDADFNPITNGEGLTQQELEETDTLEFIAQSLPVYTNKVTLLSQKEFVETLFEALGEKDIHSLGEKSISWFKSQDFSLIRPRLMSGYTYPDFTRGDIKKKFVQLLVKNRVKWHQIPSASILVTKEVTLPSSISHFLTQEDRVEGFIGHPLGGPSKGTDTMTLPVAQMKYQDVVYTELNEVRNILSSLKVNVTDDELEQVDIWELAYWGPAAVQNKATKDIIPRNKGKINRRVAVLLKKSDDRIPLLDHKANLLSKKEFRWGEGLSHENLRLALQARPENELSLEDNSSLVAEMAELSPVENKSDHAPIKIGTPGFKDVFAGLEPKVILLDPLSSTGDEEEPPVHPTEIIVTKSPSLFNEEDEMVAVGSKEWANILKSVIGQALSGKEDLDKIEILLPTIMVADPSSSQLSSLLKGKNYHGLASAKYQEFISATRSFVGETGYLPLTYHGKRSPRKLFTESQEVPLLVCHYLPPAQATLMETSTKQTLTSALYKKQRTSFTSRYPFDVHPRPTRGWPTNPFTNVKGFPFGRRRPITPSLAGGEARYLHQKRPLFHEIWEPISPSSWMIMYKLCFAMWVQEMGKDFYKQYGKEILLYALHLLAALGFNAQDIQDIIEDLGLEDSSIRIIRQVDKKFVDIAGINSILPELGEIVWFLRSSGRGGQAPKGILLVGPPGTGKTFVVQALAGEAKVPVIVQSASALTDPNQKQSGSQKLRDLFDQARQLSPCILFIDEIDTLGVARPHVIGNTMGKDELLESIEKGIDKSGEAPPELHFYQQFLGSPKNMREDPEDQESQQVISWESKDASVLDPSFIEIIEAHNQERQSKLDRLALLMQFLMEIDGLKSLQGVVVIGATNRPSVLDPAFIRPGRFEKTLSLQLPDREKRIEILKLYAKKLDLRRSHSPNSSIFIKNGHSSRDERSLEIKDHHSQNNPILQDSIILGSEPSRSLDKVQSELASVFDKNGKGVVNEPLNQITNTPWGYIANRTAGLSAAHLAGAVNQSSIKGIIDETGHTIETIEHGINRVLKRSSRQSAYVSSYTHSPLINQSPYTIDMEIDMETDMELVCFTSFYTFASEWTSQKEKLHQCASQIVGSLEDKTVWQYILDSKNEDKHILDSKNEDKLAIDDVSISNSLKASMRHAKNIQRFAFYQSGKAILQMALPLHPSVSFLPLEPQVFHRSASDLAQLISPHGPSEPQQRTILETRLIGVYAGKAGELLGLSQCHNSSQQSETTSATGIRRPPLANEPISKSKQKPILGITGLSSQSDLGVEELTFAGLIANHMISSWYLYSKKISLQKLNLAFVSQEESEIEVDDPVLLDLFRYLEKTIENETRFAGRASFTYQQRFAPSWWQLQTMAEESLVEPNNSDWYRLHLPDPEETERNIDWVSPDDHYHSVDAKLFRDIGTNTFSSLTWNDLYLINRDYIYQALISSCFHKAITLLDKKRELLDLFADQLIRHNLLREYEIGVLWKQFHPPFSSAVAGNRQEQADTACKSKSKGNLITLHAWRGSMATPSMARGGQRTPGQRGGPDPKKGLTEETRKTTKEERGLGNMPLHKNRPNEVQRTPSQRGGTYSRRGKYRFIDFDFIKPCFFTKKKS